jgi:hypothetical protein
LTDFLWSKEEMFAAVTNQLLSWFHVHEEVVHGPFGFDAALPDERGELGVVTDAVQEGVKENGLSSGAKAASTPGGKFDLFVPVCVGSERLLKECDGASVSCEDGVDGVEGDFGVVGDGEVSDALGVTELDCNDVLEEFRDRLCIGYVAWLVEKLGMTGEELAPVLRGCFVPSQEF